MIFNTGDILVWDTNIWYDLILGVISDIKPAHVGIILKGENFRELSKRESPSNTYVTYLIDRVGPIEDVLSRLWKRKDCNSVHLVRRVSGWPADDLSIITAFKEYHSTRKANPLVTAKMFIVACTKIGERFPRFLTSSGRYMLCSAFSAYLLKEGGLLTHDALPTNLLPSDFFRMQFYQRYKYERVLIFNKGTSGWNWGLYMLTAKFSSERMESIRSERVEEIVGEWK